MDVINRYRAWVVSFALAMLLVGSFQVLFSPPTDFPVGSVVSVARGSSAVLVAEQLADARIIKRPALLRFILRVSGMSADVQAGVYRFEAPQNVFRVAFRLVAGDYGFPPARLTFFEGATVREMTAQVVSALPGISEEDFIAKAKPYEGYLFPDTYLLPPSSDAASVIALLRANFDAKTASIADDVRASGRPLSAIVIMASLLEKEARTDASRRIVAGILYNRLDLGMPLQVDAVFGYIFNRDTYSPSYDDLKVDSPYNTYTRRGLPPGPINNPGLDALLAAVHPTKTEYLYYLTGTDNLMHYATTYAGHQANQRKYLK